MTSGTAAASRAERPAEGARSWFTRLFARPGLSPAQQVGVVLGLVLWFLSWVLIWFHYQVESAADGMDVWVPFDVPYFITIGASVGLITLLTFGSFYVTRDRTPDESMRSAIAATLIVFYVVLITDLLVMPDLITGLGSAAVATDATEEAAAVTSFGQNLILGLSGFVGTIVAFYFAATAVLDKSTKDNEAKKEVARVELETSRNQLAAAERRTQPSSG